MIETWGGTFTSRKISGIQRSVQQTVDANHFTNVPWKGNGISREEEKEGGPRSCSWTECGALDMIRVPSLIPAPLSRPVWGLSSRFAGRWPGRRREIGVGVEGSECCGDSGFVAMATPLLFPCWKCRTRQESACMPISRLTPQSNPTPPSLLPPPSAFPPINTYYNMTLASETNPDLLSCKCSKLHSVISVS